MDNILSADIPYMIHSRVRPYGQRNHIKMSHSHIIYLISNAYVPNIMKSAKHAFYNFYHYYECMGPLLEHNIN